jgi:hypothetical protein
MRQASRARQDQDPGRRLTSSHATVKASLKSRYRMAEASSRVLIESAASKDSRRRFCSSGMVLAQAAFRYSYPRARY